MYGDAREDVEITPHFMVMLKDPWIENLSLLINGGKNIKENVEDNLSRLRIQHNLIKKEEVNQGILLILWIINLKRKRIVKVENQRFWKDKGKQ